MKRLALRPQPGPRTLLAVGIGLAAGPLVAAEPPRSSASLELETLHVEERRSDGYRTERSASAKNAVPLLDTPQTITVVPAEVMRDQQALSLREVLSNVSGITFNAGEGGGGSGDNLNIRGFSASTNLQIDGLRDSAQNNRTDTFNIEQVEVIKGPNSVFGGAGTTGGSVNQISKQPGFEAFSRLGLGLGSDHYRRLTLDTNQPLQELGSGSAFRLNLMAHDDEIPGRKRLERERWGIAPSLLLGLGEDTSLTLSYFHQRDDNDPDYGVPAFDGKRVAGVKRNAYFGWRNLDRERIDSDAFTVRLEHRFNDQLSLQNLTRYSEVERDTVISAAHINLDRRRSSGQPPGPVLAPGQYLPAGPQAYGRDVTSRMWINQTNLTAEFDTLGIGHTLVTGAEFSRETYHRTTYDYGLKFPDEGYPLADPPGYWSGPAQRSNSGYLATRLYDRALYAFDTLALNPQWDLNLGLRYDWLDGDADDYKLTKGNWVATDNRSSDEHLSGRAGLVYKPVENGRFYLAYGTSFNPSAENIATSGAGLSAATEKLDPEKNRTWELGTKWELLERRLQLDAALFRVEKLNARTQLTDGTTILAGNQRVQGLELGLTGELNERWKVFSTFTFMDSETLKAVNERVGVSAKGQALANTPPQSFNLWSTYDFDGGWRVGYGARYVSQRNLTASDDGVKLAAYWVHSAMLGYRVSDSFDLQLNLDNLFDRQYVERVRTQLGTQQGTGSTGARSSAIEYGDARAATLNATLSF
ncbi:TonB-dependent siderophore receptor [Pseudomonas otitidis]|uniref:TonB-dependent receptor n=1 Tax=Metapseudomonas otitidis TaxID=319939 RepID=UPI00244902FB|nr:TonB-dependent siderophore receptor [Pseudomonas otitidis]MDH1109077.1 TonB-dependent siderophore receptor [Pseudomonas otitidis]MDH1159827.1 TonB-dependent siderophore receptor [Pseudomonas otitidis]MDH1167324.1 TonB-dependent siderophore receptor [Pseudomonas otitidis]